jgi:hypothetical protein
MRAVFLFMHKKKQGVAWKHSITNSDTNQALGTSIYVNLVGILFDWQWLFKADRNN